MTDLLHNIEWVLPLRTPALTTLAFALSWLGYSTFIMFFMAVGYWALSKTIFFRVMLLIMFSALLNAFVKDLFQDPRPPLALRLDDLVGNSYGLPSGHAQLAVVIWMWLAYEMKRTWVWIACSLITLGVILSRLYLGAHDLEDVLVGAALGALTLIAFIQIKDRKWLWQRHPAWSMTAITAVTTAALLCWPNKAVPPDYIVTIAAWMAGGIVGLHYEEKLLGFNVLPACRNRILAALTGIISFILLQKVLKLADTLPLPVLPWQLVKGLIIGFFIAWPVPWLLVKIRLATRRR
ncbi:phosphatase PAP2 family protein [Undibacterium terreum]|uniref:Phosphatidic acid phosphatase type 2/haloperoxidase domain-containing protein n=1 Tax=Undibacterium terreum TaxID=1224302 RepID=A0A916U7Z4_9BURK|nr:phosphatase PAP2 family protein [Undibacterium terreum]GGC63947.1 hypothetical protein GCM10011396_08620 [Undibacterium terreum]